MTTKQYPIGGDKPTITPEELMMPRYKVMADYPDNKNKVGDIIEVLHAGTKEAAELVCRWYDKFPVIYKRLEWWEERKPEEMPEYVKWDYDPKTDDINTKGLVEKVIKWAQDGYGVVINESMIIATCHWLPATCEEYEQYNKRKDNE